MPTALEMQLCDRAALGHAWEDVADDRPRDERHSNIGFAQYCPRCQTMTYVDLHWDYTVARRTYKRHPDWQDRWGVGGERPNTLDIRRMRVDKQRQIRRLQTKRKSQSPRLQVIQGSA